MSHLCVPCLSIPRRAQMQASESLARDGRRLIPQPLRPCGHLRHGLPGIYTRYDWLALSPTRYCIRNSLGLVWKSSTGGRCARLQYFGVALPFCVATAAIPYCNTALIQSKNHSRRSRRQPESPHASGIQTLFTAISVASKSLYGFLLNNSRPLSRSLFAYRLCQREGRLAANTKHTRGLVSSWQQRGIGWARTRPSVAV